MDQWLVQYNLAARHAVYALFPSALRSLVCACACVRECVCVRISVAGCECAYCKCASVGKCTFVCSCACNSVSVVGLGVWAREILFVWWGGCGRN